MASNLFGGEAYRTALRFDSEIDACAGVFEVFNAARDEPLDEGLDEAFAEIFEELLEPALDDPRTFDLLLCMAARRLRIEGAKRTGSATFTICPALIAFADR